MKAYVKTPYSDASGDHEVGDEVEFPRDTDEEKAAFDRLVATGIITTRKSDLPEDKAGAGGEPEPDDIPAEDLAATTIKQQGRTKKQQQG